MSPMMCCRLCMSMDSLNDIYQVDSSDTRLDVMTASCIDLKIQPGDGLPTKICIACVMKIKEFFNFKQKCIETASKLKTLSTITNQVSNSNHTDIKLDTDVKIEYDIVENISNYKDVIDCWLSYDTRADFNIINIEENCPVANWSKKKKSEQIMIQKKVRRKCIKNYQCELCGHIIKNRTTFKRHLMSHSGMKLFACKLCPKKFTRDESKSNHMRSHMGIRPYICDICGNTSTRKTDLIRHMVVHSDEKKYACPRCNRRFKRSSDIQSHMRTHTGVRPYICNLCEKDYSSRSGLRKHFRKHIPREKVYKCVQLSCDSIPHK